MRLKLPRSAKITKRAHFLQIKKCRLLKSQNLLINLKPEACTKLGLTVSRRFGSSPLRAAFKRSVREAFRHLMPEFKYPFHMNVRPRGSFTPSFHQIYDEMRSILPLHPPTLIIRHRRENKKKCSLTPLVNKPGFTFHTYPGEAPTLPSNTILLTPNAPPLSPSDAGAPLLLIDSTWHLAPKIINHIDPDQKLIRRSLNPTWKTAYPRCQEIETGLASIEALYAAYTCLNYERSSLLDSYYWKENFLDKNSPLLQIEY